MKAPTETERRVAELRSRLRQKNYELAQARSRARAAQRELDKQLKALDQANNEVDDLEIQLGRYGG